MPHVRVIRLASTAAVALAALVAAPVGAADHLPSTLSVAKDGNLEVFSSIFVSHTAVEQRGGWLNESLGCQQWRRLIVRANIFRTRFGHTQSRSFVRSRPVQNCAEGGPNMGFSKTATGVGLGCASGKWKPGRYEMVTRTVFVATGLTSVASTGFKVSAAC